MVKGRKIPIKSRREKEVYNKCQESMPRVRVKKQKLTNKKDTELKIEIKK